MSSSPPSPQATRVQGEVALNESEQQQQEPQDAAQRAQQQGSDAVHPNAPAPPSHAHGQAHTEGQASLNSAAQEAEQPPAPSHPEHLSEANADAHQHPHHPHPPPPSAHPQAPYPHHVMHHYPYPQHPSEYAASRSSTHPGPETPHQAHPNAEHTGALHPHDRSPFWQPHIPYHPHPNDAARAEHAAMPPPPPPPHAYPHFHPPHGPPPDPHQPPTSAPAPGHAAFYPPYYSAHHSHAHASRFAPGYHHSHAYPSGSEPPGVPVPGYGSGEPALAGHPHSTRPTTTDHADTTSDSRKHEEEGDRHSQDTHAAYPDSDGTSQTGGRRRSHNVAAAAGAVPTTMGAHGGGPVPTSQAGIAPAALRFEEIPALASVPRSQAGNNLMKSLLHVISSASQVTHQLQMALSGKRERRQRKGASKKVPKTLRKELRKMLTSCLEANNVSLQDIPKGTKVARFAPVTEAMDLVIVQARASRGEEFAPFSDQDITKTMLEILKHRLHYMRLPDEKRAVKNQLAAEAVTRRRRAEAENLRRLNPYPRAPPAPVDPRCGAAVAGVHHGPVGDGAEAHMLPAAPGGGLSYPHPPPPVPPPPLPPQAAASAPSAQLHVPQTQPHVQHAVHRRGENNTAEAGHPPLHGQQPH